MNWVFLIIAIFLINHTNLILGVIYKDDLNSCIKFFLFKYTQADTTADVSITMLRCIFKVRLSGVLTVDIQTVLIELGSDGSSQGILVPDLAVRVAASSLLSGHDHNPWLVHAIFDFQVQVV